MNKNTRRKLKDLRKSGNYFHGITMDSNFNSKYNKNSKPKKYPQISAKDNPPFLRP